MAQRSILRDACGRFIELGTALGTVGDKIAQVLGQAHRRVAIPEQVRLFCSPAAEAQYAAAYQAVLQQWPVPYEELYVPTRFGATHVIASGPPDAAPLVLLASSGAGAPQWFLNVGPLSQRFRTYAVDLIGEVNKSVPIRPVRSTWEFAAWAGDLFDGLQVESAYMVGLDWCPV